MMFVTRADKGTFCLLRRSIMIFDHCHDGFVTAAFSRMSHGDGTKPKASMFLSWSATGL
jgi:hypothetical protein